MKPIFVAFCFCLVFVPKLITVHGNELIERLMDSGGNINEQLQILLSEPLGHGGFGLVYKGIRTSINGPRLVAVKFFPRRFDKHARNEYSLYWYLDAINNPSVEKFGIPAVYYYDKWEDFIVMAVTLCEGSLRERRFPLSPLNALIIFQQFVLQSKYLHRHGIRHDDLKPDNILLRKHQTFLIDYNLGSKFGEDTRLCTYRYKPRIIYDTGRIRRAIDDWESFFYAMAEMCGVSFKWLSSEKYRNLSARERDRKYGEDKEDVQDIFNRINAIESTPLRIAFMAFAREIYSKKVEEFPDYDRTYRLITGQIRNVSTSNPPIFFTWMNSEAIEEAKKHIKTNGIPVIRTIKDPRQFNGFYSCVNFDYFNGSTTAGSSRHHKTRKSQNKNCLAFFRQLRRSEMSNKK